MVAYAPDRRYANREVLLEAISSALVELEHEVVLPKRIAWKPFFLIRDRFKSNTLAVLTGLKETEGRVESLAAGTDAFIDQLGQTACRMEPTIFVALSRCRAFGQAPLNQAAAPPPETKHLLSRGESFAMLSERT